MATVGIKGLMTVPTEFRKNVYLLDNYTVHEKTVTLYTLPLANNASFQRNSMPKLTR